MVCELRFNQIWCSRPSDALVRDYGVHRLILVCRYCRRCTVFVIPFILFFRPCPYPSEDRCTVCGGANGALLSEIHGRYVVVPTGALLTFVLRVAIWVDGHHRFDGQGRLPVQIILLLALYAPAVGRWRMGACPARPRPSWHPRSLWHPVPSWQPTPSWYPHAFVSPPLSHGAPMTGRCVNCSRSCANGPWCDTTTMWCCNDSPILRLQEVLCLFPGVGV